MNIIVFAELVVKRDRGGRFPFFHTHSLPTPVREWNFINFGRKIPHIIRRLRPTWEGMIASHCGA